MPERHDNTIYKLFFRSKKIIKVTPNSITRIGLIICIEDFEEAFSGDYIYIEEDIKVEETTVIDIVTISHPIKSDAIFIINPDASQANIQQKRDNIYTLNINNMPNMQRNRRLY